MTTTQPGKPNSMPESPDLVTGDAAFDTYTAGLTGEQAPLLGHLVLYSIFEGDVTPKDLQAWFAELGLDPYFCPPPLRAVDAYERVTGPDGVRVSYPLDDPSATTPAAKRRHSRNNRGAGKTASLMVRPVRRDGGQIVRHVVREVRDEEKTRLSYDTHLAAVIFERDNSKGSDEGAGSLRIEPDRSAIDQLPEAERATVRAMLDEIEESYRRRCTYVSADRLRTVLRSYVEYLHAIRVRPTGGVYFVHHQHAATLAALRELVGRFGEDSHLVRVPLPDAGEMREMVIAAFTTKAKEDLNKLARDIAAAQSDGRTDTEVQKLYRRFTDLQKATSEHADLLSTTLDDTNAALQLVKVQLGSLLAAAPTDAADQTDPEDGP